MFPRSAAIVIGATASAGGGGARRSPHRRRNASNLVDVHARPRRRDHTGHRLANHLPRGGRDHGHHGNEPEPRLLGRRQRIEAYRVGAEGERGAAKQLERLAAQGWIVLHDRRLPGGRENVDHVAVGPPGIVVVETKNWSGDVVVTNDGLRRNGRDARSAIEQVLRQVPGDRIALPSWSTVAVRPVLYLHREIDRPGPRRRAARPGGVPVSGPRDLLAIVRAGPRLLDPAGIVGLASSLDLALPPS